MMIMNKVRFTLIYGIGWCQLAFSKDYELAFVPFEGMHVYYETDEHEISFDLVSNRYQDTQFFFNLEDYVFTIQIQEKWEWHTRHIKDVLRKIDSLKGLGWTTDSDQGAISKFVDTYSRPDSKGGDNE